MMNDSNRIRLQHLPVDRETSQFIQSAANHFQAAFPGRIRSIHLEGSYAVNAQISTSDMDLTVIFREKVGEGVERTRLNQFIEQLAQTSSIELDISVVDEGILSKTGLNPMLKLGSQFVSGEDIRSRYELVKIDS